MAKKYFTVQEANELLPEIRSDLQQLQQIKRDFERKYRELQSLSDAPKAGGPEADERFLLECRIEFLQIEAKTLFASFELKGVEIKDIDSGLVDFPSVMDGEEVLLCWRQGEERVAHYHSLHDGFAGRKKLSEREGGGSVE